MMSGFAALYPTYQLEGLKNRLNKEGSEAVTKCNRLKLVAEDGKITTLVGIRDY
jgi:hypothetical protein